MLRFKGECSHFRFNKCSIYIHGGASAQFSTNSHETDNSVVRRVQNSPRNLLRWVWSKKTAGRTPGCFSMCILTQYCLANMKDNGGVSRSPSRIPHCLIECGLFHAFFLVFCPWFFSVLRFRSWIFYLELKSFNPPDENLLHLRNIFKPNLLSKPNSADIQFFFLLVSKSCAIV